MQYWKLMSQTKLKTILQPVPGTKTPPTSNFFLTSVPSLSLKKIERTIGPLYIWKYGLTYVRKKLASSKSLK